MSSLLLFVIAATIWGTSWIAITFQIGATSPEAGVAIRFTLAAVLLAAWCGMRGISLRLGRRDHLWLAALGASGFCASYLFVYYAERHVVSGLVAVGYAAAPLINMLLARALFGTPLSARVGAGGALGLTGIALIFAPAFARTQSGTSTDNALLIGGLLTAGGVLTSCLSNMIVLRNQRADLRGWAPLAYAMGYGALATWVTAAAIGAPLRVAWSFTFALSLAYLVGFASVIAFGAYYALVGRIGPARAAYVGVIATVIAFCISTLFEGYDGRLAGLFGVTLVVFGNYIALREDPNTTRS